MQINDLIHGFRVLRRREVAEPAGVFWEMEHERSGAQLAWFECEEENKLFSVAFKTLPWDDTGVFHIMEHSVLAGSEHFPVKEPFLDLLKSSMNTFLNAMTYADKTVYPGSSRNEQDFLNLTEVYLDAVFCPAVYTEPNIFRQEGWHYELRSPEDTPIYKGVVFNEMKGAYANIDSLIDKGVTRMLFPESPYGFDSGGDPAAIPSLTRERFLDAHREFYHPSNARIWLDGAVPLDRVLALIDEKYLSRYARSEVRHEIPVQAPVPAAEKTAYYAAGAAEETAEKTHIVFGKILGSWCDRKKLAAAHILASYLTDSNASPLKRAVLSAELAQDVEFYIEDEVFQPYLVLKFRNTEASRKEAIRRCLRDTVGGLLRKGLDREELEAELNQFDFSLRAPHEPKGLVRNLDALVGWLHGGDPLDFIVHRPLLTELRAALGSSYFEDLLREMLLDDAHLCALTLLPSKTKGDEDSAREAAALAGAAAGWTAADRARIVAENEALDLWHDTPDPPEATATLPVLSLSDVSAEPQWMGTELRGENGVPVYFHCLPANGIVYTRAMFDLNDAAAEELPALSFLTDLLGELPTARYDERALQREIKKTIGWLSFDIVSYPDHADPARCRVRFVAAFGALEEQFGSACALVAEILLHTDFSDASKLRELLLQSKDDVYQNVLTRGSAFATRRAGAAVSAAASVSELTDGLRFYDYLKAFEASFDSSVAAFSEKMRRFCGTRFVRPRLSLGVTASAAPSFAGFLAAIPDGAASGLETSVVAPGGAAVKEAVCIPSGVSYAAAVSSIRPFGAEFSGALNVLNNILTYGYLWNEIRVKGGAYGCGFRAGETGGAAFYSYRDPAPLASLNTFAATADFLRAFTESEEDLEKYIIGEIAADEPLFGPSALGATADSNLLSGITLEEKRRIRREMLALKKADIAALIPLFEKLAAAASVCVVGNEEAMKPELADFSVIRL